MSNKAVANRYAVALFELGETKGLVNEFEKDLLLVTEVFEQTPELVKLLQIPSLPLAQKQQLIKQSFENNVHGTTLAVVLRLLERNRFSVIPELAPEYKKLNNEKKGIAEALVYSAKPLSDEEQNQVAAVFAPKAGKRALEVKNIVQKELIGGIKVRVGDRVFDGSVKGQLNRLEKGLLAGN
ncbi:F-type H+-transporting ATPase subunit delta [Alkalihalobacillus xiaoxiensis]|uniref:ATP synthase subunit delta n=1 Tax=Shouchella xiaoxiensis TaxID=766895 RepID=A0ABS2SVM9_9BACI|nr:F0F1 ATP synthase subunit delta [Shouchella xiaoxiensis]MBM7839557.1 F-type H+-transporting ATPase subunit delta [Shouchella xiaoxiensis]